MKDVQILRCLKNDPFRDDYPKNIMQSSKLTDFLLIILSLLSWLFIVGAKYADYDNNYVFLSGSFLISLMGTLFIILAWILKKDFVKESTLTAILFLVTTSPLSIFLFLEISEMEMKR